MSPDQFRGQGPRWPGVTAWGLAALFVAIFGLILWLDSRVYAVYFPDLGPFAWLGLHGIWLGPFIVFAVVGALIASRRRRHPIGWIMVTSALAGGVGEAARMYAALVIGTAPADPPILALALKPASEPLTVTGLVLGLVFIPLLFPSGRLPSRRWRFVPWVAGLVPAVFLVNSVLSPRISHSMNIPGREGQVQLYDVANPLSPAGLGDVLAAVPTGVATALLPLLILAAGAAVVARFRGSEGVERQQMKWFVYAAGLVAVAASVMAVASLVATDGPGSVQGVLLVAGLSAYPVAVGVAVLRYRLYEIDRIISRTVSYGLVVVILGAVYVGAIVGLGAAATAITGAEDSDLVVALSTLLAAGLFQPVRTRVQTAVDRRFNRTGYEARQAVEAFARHVRDEVDLDQIRQHIAETAAKATQPTKVSVWLPDREQQRS